MARVFLSDATENLVLVHDVHDWLVRAGHDVFFARDNHDGIAVGDAWKQRLYRELNRVDAVVCVVTDAYLDFDAVHGRGRHCRLPRVPADPVARSER